MGAGAKTRLESRIKKFTPHCVCRYAAVSTTVTLHRIAACDQCTNHTQNLCQGYEFDTFQIGTGGTHGHVGPSLAEVGCSVLDSHYRIWRKSYGPVYIAIASTTPATTTTTTPTTTTDFRVPAAKSTLADGTGPFSTTGQFTTITVNQQLVARVKELEKQLEDAGCDANSNQTICQELKEELGTAIKSLEEEKKRVDSANAEARSTTASAAADDDGLGAGAIVGILFAVIVIVAIGVAAAIVIKNRDGDAGKAVVASTTKFTFGLDAGGGSKASRNSSNSRSTAATTFNPSYQPSPTHIARRQSAPVDVRMASYLQLIHTLAWVVPPMFCMVLNILT